MPFTIEKNSKKQFCVFKKDAEDKVTGKSLGCHKTKKMAVAQIGAIESSEREKGKSMSSGITNNFFVSTGELTPIESFENITGTITEEELMKNTGQEDAKTLTEEKIETQEAEKEEVVYTEKASDFAGIPTGLTSLNSAIRKVRRVWDEQFGFSGFIVEVFTDKVIAFKDKTHWSVPITEDADGKITFSKVSDWTEVELQKEWVEKTFPLIDLIDPVSNPLKSIGDNRLGGYLMLWGDKNSKDFHGEWFTEETVGVDAVFKQMGKLPFLFDHGADSLMKATVIGEVDTMKADEKGVWHEIQIKRIKLYNQMLKPYVDAGKMGCSSSTYPAMKRVAKTGEIKQWVVSESTGTFVPADKRQVTEHPFEELKHLYKQIGLIIDEKEPLTLTEESEGNEHGVEKARLLASIQQQGLRIRLSKLINI